MQKNGFSLIEIVIIIAVLILLITIVALPLNSFRKQQALQNSTNSLVAVLNDARTKTFAAVDNESYSVFLDSQKVVLFKGQSYLNQNPSNEEYYFDQPVSANWNIQGGSNVISFQRLKGATDQYGTINLLLPNGKSNTVTITELGLIFKN